MNIKLSILLEGALAELEVFEQTENAKVNMGCWVETHGKLCFACLGGVWALKKLGVKDYGDAEAVEDIYDSCNNNQIRRQEQALNSLRTGRVGTAYYTINDKLATEATMLNRDVVHYHEDEEAFKKDMRQLVVDLRGVGL